MSEIELSDFPGNLTLRPVLWRCAKHGQHDQVLTFIAQHVQRTVCVPCLLELLERLGIVDLPRVD